MRIRNGLIYRKLIHLSSTVYPLILYHLPEKYGEILSAILIFVSLSVERLRVKRVYYRNLFNKFFGRFLKTDEYVGGLTGATTLLVSSFICYIFFERNIALYSLLLLTISDGLSTIIGVTFGKRKIFGQKTLEGSLVFLISGLVISLFMPLPLLLKISGALIGMVVELFSDYLGDDNFSIPLITGLILTILRKII